MQIKDEKQKKGDNLDNFAITLKSAHIDQLWKFYPMLFKNSES